MGKWPGSVYGRIQTDSTGTHAMEHFIDVVLQLEPPVLSMVRRPLPPHYLNPSFQPSFT